jgi:hypothetical protein
MAVRTYANTSNIEQIYYDKMGVARVLKPGQSFQEEIIPGERNLILGGKELDFAGVVVNVLARDRDGNVLFAHGMDIPSGKAGFSKGCLFIKTDAPDGSKAVYENKGVISSCLFDVIGDISGAEIADGAITNAKVANDAAIAGTKISPDFGSQNIVTKGHAAVGNNANFDSLQVININEISSQQYIYGLYADMQPIYSGGPSVAVGVTGQVNRDTAADFGTIYGGYFNANAINNSSPQKTIGTLQGLSVSAVTSGDYTTVNYLCGLSSQVSVAYNMVSEAIAEMVAGSFHIFLGSGQIDVTLAKTLSVEAEKGGTITGSLGTLYGVYIGDHSALGFSTDYNLYSAGASSKNKFEGSVDIDGHMAVGETASVNTLVGLSFYHTSTFGDQYAYGINGRARLSDHYISGAYLYGINFETVAESAGSWNDSLSLDYAAGLLLTIRAHAEEYTAVNIVDYRAIDLSLQFTEDPAGGSPYPGSIGVANAAGIHLRSPAKNGDPSITYLYGIYIEDQTVGGLGSSGNYNLFSAGVGARHRLQGNLEFGNAATAIAALADTIRLYGKDYAAADARLYIQSELGNPIVLGNNEVQIGGAKVLGARVIDNRIDDTLNSGDATTDGVIDAIRDCLISHGLIAAA